MEIEFYSDMPGDLVQPILGTIQIEPYDTIDQIPELPPATAVVDPAISSKAGCVREFINAQSNSRLITELPQGNWETDPDTNPELDPKLYPSFIMGANQRILVEGMSSWQIFNEQLNPVSNGVRGDSGIVLDPSTNLLFYVDLSGLIKAHSLKTGDVAFKLELCMGDEYARTFMVPNDTSILVVAVEQVMDEESPPPETSTIEIYTWGDLSKIGKGEKLSSSHISADLVAETTQLFAAMYNNTLVLASDNSLYHIDTNLKADTNFMIQKEFVGDFIPLALSVDEVGTMYVLNYNMSGKAISSISPEGKLRFMRFLPLEVSDMGYPPLVCYDHRVIIQAAGKLYAFDQFGRDLWEWSAPGKLGGVVITSDDLVLVSADDQVGTIDKHGEYSTLLTLPDGPVTTPPLLTEQGDILIATNRKLYRYSVV